MLKITNLYVSSGKKEILKGINLTINPGEIHVVMGPNGSGKSTLSLALLGHPSYQITSGQINLNGKDITKLSTDKRARLGIFLSMQSPIAIPGVSVLNLIRSATKNMTQKATEPLKFVAEIKKNLQSLKLDEGVMTRSIHESFSGGEKKKIEVLQLAMIKPRYLILDETDSGLDVDALKVVGEGINNNSGSKTGVLLITHYQRILKYIKPDFVHILVNGRIVKSGDFKLAEIVEQKGYERVGND